MVEKMFKLGIQTVREGPFNAAQTKYLGSPEHSTSDSLLLKTEPVPDWKLPKQYVISDQSYDPPEVKDPDTTDNDTTNQLLLGAPRCSTEHDPAAPTCRDPVPNPS